MWFNKKVSYFVAWDYYDDSMNIIGVGDGIIQLNGTMTIEDCDSIKEKINNMCDREFYVTKITAITRL